jgi:hypothetical protein
VIPRTRWLIGVAAAIVVATDARAQAPVPPDSVSPAIRRAQRLVNDGSGAEGRALLDSILNVSEPRSPAEAQALFWRATLAESWAQAEKDYLRLMLEHDTSAYAGRAMLRLAQGEVARGDKDAALRYLERLALQAPESPSRAEGGVWHARLLIERGAREEGCLVLRLNRPRVAAGSIELENQYDYLLRGCPERGVAAASDSTPAAPTSPPAPPPSAAPQPAPVTPTTPAPSTAPPTEGELTHWSVQVAAFSSAAEATALASTLRARGYDTRVDGTTAPFRVRFGRYATREDAAAAMARYQSQERADAFLARVPRG